METQLESNIDSNNTRLEEEIELVSNILKTELTARVDVYKRQRIFIILFLLCTSYIFYTYIRKHVIIPQSGVDTYTDAKRIVA